jgi:hypothetical protein
VLGNPREMITMANGDSRSASGSPFRLAVSASGMLE